MNVSIRILQGLGLALLALPLTLLADSWSCRKNNDVREIHIVRPSGEAVPCQVVYKKLTEGVEDQVLWSAENDAAFCEDKAKAFVEKQVGWGWTCVETIADKATEETAVETPEASAVEQAPAEAAPAESAPATE